MPRALVSAMMSGADRDTAGEKTCTPTGSAAVALSSKHPSHLSPSQHQAAPSRPAPKKNQQHQNPPHQPPPSPEAGCGAELA